MNDPATLPQETLRTLEIVPPDVHAALLIRHSHREPIPNGQSGDELDITPGGVKIAEELGAHLCKRKPGRILTSPLQRCVTTSIALARGAGWSMTAIVDRRLGAPGAFVVDGDTVLPYYLEHGAIEMVQRQLEDPASLPGMRSTPDGVAVLLGALTEGSAGSGGIDVLITHDALLAVFVGRQLDVSFSAENWPRFLDGAFVWKEGEALVVGWRGEVRSLRAWK